MRRDEILKSDVVKVEEEMMKGEVNIRGVSGPRVATLRIGRDRRLFRNRVRTRGTFNGS